MSSKNIRMTAMDVHSDHIDIGSFKPTGKHLVETNSACVKTSIKPIKDFLESIPGKHVLIFEEGSMSAWLKRNLKKHAEKVIVSDPRKNALIYAGDTKSDGIDPGKLAQLYYTGAITEVYHTDDSARQGFKDLILHYHKTAKTIAAAKNRINAFYKQLGITDTPAKLYKETAMGEYQQQIQEGFCEVILKNQYAILKNLSEIQDRTRLRIARQSKKFKVIERFQALPGVGAIISATFYAIIDTPYRFRDKRKLWHYCGLAAGVKTSNGKWIGRPGLLKGGNHLLKSMLIHAAKCCCSRSKDPYIKSYINRMVERNKSRAAIRNAVARKLSAIMWGMWKTETPYSPELVMK